MAAGQRAIFELADAFGSARVNAIQVVDPAEVPAELLAERFAAVCDLAAAHGLTVAFEPRANSPVESPAAALELLAAAGRENTGITLDAYHFHRAGLTLEDLDGVPAESVVAVQLNDMRAQLQGSPLEDALEHRLAPGEGVIDLPAWLAGLRAHGVKAPFAVEVLSREFMQLPLELAAERAARGGRKLLAGVAEPPARSRPAAAPRSRPRERSSRHRRRNAPARGRSSSTPPRGGRSRRRARPSHRARRSGVR